MKSILLCGAAGRMGHEIIENASRVSFQVSMGVDAHAVDAELPFPLYPSFSLVAGRADVLMDFSRPEVLPDLLQFAKARKIPCVLAATGYLEADKAMIAQAAKDIPIFQSANMSIGVYVLKVLSQQAKKMLDGFDIEIIEKHHRNKLDAPSGTALMLLDALSSPETEPVFGRNSRTERREPRDIGVHAIRGGTVPGEHEIDFLGDNEVITLTHSAQSRTIFALGALRAAAFLLKQPTGLYGMDDLMKSV